MPLGQTVEWEAEIINDKPNEMIAWRSLPGSEVDTAGSVHFKPVGGGRGTEVHVNLKYNPPGGVVGAAVAKLFGQARSNESGKTCAISSNCWRPGRPPQLPGNRPAGRGVEARHRSLANGVFDAPYAPPA